MIQLKKSNVLQTKQLKSKHIDSLVKVGATATEMSSMSTSKTVSYVVGGLTVLGGAYLIFNKHPVVGSMLAVPALIWLTMGAPAVENWS